VGSAGAAVAVVSAAAAQDALALYEVFVCMDNSNKFSEWLQCMSSSIFCSSSLSVYPFNHSCCDSRGHRKNKKHFHDGGEREWLTADDKFIAKSVLKNIAEEVAVQYESGCENQDMEIVKGECSASMSGCS